MADDAPVQTTEEEVAKHPLTAYFSVLGVPDTSHSWTDCWAVRFNRDASDFKYIFDPHRFAGYPKRPLYELPRDLETVSSEWKPPEQRDSKDHFIVAHRDLLVETHKAASSQHEFGDPEHEAAFEAALGTCLDLWIAGKACSHGSPPVVDVKPD